MVFDLGTRELFLENDLAHEVDEVENINILARSLDSIIPLSFICLGKPGKARFGLSIILCHRQILVVECPAFNCSGFL